MTDKKIDSVRLQNIVQGFGQSAALMSAVELGIFTAIDGGATTIESVAEAVEIHPVNAERLLTMLTAMNLVHLDENGFSNADDVARFLVEDSPRYAGPWMLFNKPQWNDWGQLTDHLRAKELKVLGPIGDFTVDDARAYHKATYSIGMGAGRRFVRHVDLAGRKKILDLGGGSGAYCINAANTYPEITAVVFDLPSVAEVAREFIAENGVQDRVSAIGGDFTQDEFPSGADVVIMASNLPMYGPDMIGRVVQKAFDALEPGGEMHLIGETLNDDRVGPIGPAYWGLGQAISETEGVAHSEADCIGYFETAGFKDVAAIPFIEGTLTRIHGLKPLA
ncbi:MAG: methyltransferase domain-containing protein [Rhodospirillaceae bacterium]|mgnify:CR=1 FL=1|nr:methyltransferase domain-containing protein [Rhodospirillaceae bacterium]